MAGKHWDIREIQKMRALVASGVRRFELPDYFPDRTRKAVLLRYDTLELHSKEERGCTKLREATLDLFVRTANRYCIGLEDAMACHLGRSVTVVGHHRPAPLQSFNAARLAA